MEWEYFSSSSISAVASSILLICYATYSGDVLSTTRACNSSFSLFKSETVCPSHNTFSSANIYVVMSIISSHEAKISLSSCYLSSTALVLSSTTVSCSIFIRSIFASTFVIFSRDLTKWSCTIVSWSWILWLASFYSMATICICNSLKLRLINLN